MRRDAEARWKVVQANASYCHGALTECEGRRINWHSPAAEHSSQIVCISVLRPLQTIAGGQRVFSALASAAFGRDLSEPWRFQPEHSTPGLRAALGELGRGTPSMIDMFCESGHAVVCAEAKFLADAKEGFGRCGQFASGKCAGFRGPASDREGGTDVWCRLEAADGDRQPRNYWSLGREFLMPEVFREQRAGERCALRDSNFQLMRNLLAAASSARGEKFFGVLCLVPEKTKQVVVDQAAAFRERVLLPQFRSRVAVATYDALCERLLESPEDACRRHGEFLRNRLEKLLAAA